MTAQSVLFTQLW